MGKYCISVIILLVTKSNALCCIFFICFLAELNRIPVQFHCGITFPKRKIDSTCITVKGNETESIIYTRRRLVVDIFTVGYANR